MNRPPIFSKTQDSIAEEEDEETYKGKAIDFPLEQIPTTKTSHYSQNGIPEEDDIPPDGGLTAWTCCGAVALINGFTWGVAAVRFSCLPQAFHGPFTNPLNHT